MTYSAMKPLSDLPPDTIVWRYLAFRRLYDAVKSQCLPLTLLQQYVKGRDPDDPYETSVPEQTVQDDCQIVHGGQTTTTSMMPRPRCPRPYNDQNMPDAFKLPEPKQRLDNISRMRRAVLRAAYSSCWRGDESESEAMWRIYCAGTEGVAIRSTYGKLQDTFSRPSSVVVSPIKYIGYQNGVFIKHQEPWHPALHKRGAFAHEKEVRILYFNKDNYQCACDDENFCPENRYEKLSWDPVNVVDRIVLNPRADDNYHEFVVDILKTLPLDLSGKVHPSSLAKPPNH